MGQRKHNNASVLNGEWYHKTLGDPANLFTCRKAFLTEENKILQKERVKSFEFFYGYVIIIQ